MVKSNAITRAKQRLGVVQVDRDSKQNSMGGAFWKRYCVRTG